MKLSAQIHGFRVLSVLVILTVAVLPILIKPSVTFALVLYPVVLIALMCVIALVEQYLLHKQQHSEAKIQVQPIKIHKRQMKKVRSYRHSGCRLLGLSCAA